MNRKIKLSQAISYVVITLAVLTFLAVWPGNLIQSSFLSKSDEATMTESEPVSVEKNITQMFVGEGGELKSVELYVYNDMVGETITFRLYDASYEQLFNIFYVVKNSDVTPGFIEIPVGYYLEDGIDYFYTIEGLSTDMTVGIEEYASSTSMVNGYMSYGGIEDPEWSVVARYHYANPFVSWQLIIIGMVILAATFGLCFFIQKYFEKNQEKNKTLRVQRLLQWTINPIATIGFIWSILMVYPGRKLCAELENYLFFWSGFVILYCIILAYVNFPRKNGNQENFTINFKQIAWGNVFQIIAVAGLLWSCFEYMNGLYNIHHAYAGYKIIFWVAVMIITTYSQKEIFNWINFIWIVAGINFCYFYVKPHIGIDEEEGLYRLAARAIFVCGFVIIHFVRIIIQLIKKKIKMSQLKLSFFIPYAGLFVLLCAFRNSSWPVFAVVICGVVFLRFLFWEKREVFLGNFCNGLILNFFMMWFFCMWHRPYHRYMITRYSMGFHTVTMTGTYLTLIFAAVMVKLLHKYRKDRSLIGLLPECILLGLVANYIFITLSRTAYMAAAGMGLFILGLYVCWEYGKKNRWKEFLRKTFIALVTIFVMFPVTFTLTRTIPAFINEPVIYDVEERGDAATIRKGQATDSEYYMDLEHFLQYFMRKVIGIDDYEIYWSENRAAKLADNQTSQIKNQKADGIDESVQKNGAIESEEKLVLVEENEVALAEEPEDLEEKDITNGRMDIYKAYISEWNLTGHETMETESLPSGHAHSIYLQVMHDHGMIVGIYFIMFLLFTVILILINMRNKMKSDIYVVFPAAVLVGFIIAGTVEWIFHICNPYGMTVFMLLIPMCFKEQRKRNE